MELIVFVVVFSTLFFVKNHMVYTNHKTAIRIVYAQDNWSELSLKYTITETYFKHFLNPFKWTFESMFPGLKELDK